MPARHILLDQAAAEQVPAPIREGFDTLRQKLGVPAAFPDEVEQDAQQAARLGPLDGAPDAAQLGITGRADRTDIAFVTIDPIGSMDLDQAMFLERVAEGADGAATGARYRVWYAIADVAAWVRPGSPVDAEAHRRGQTFYAPFGRAPLHPTVLSEGAASLLADGTSRPALVWRIELDAAGVQVSATVERALVRSRERLDYPGVQQQLDAGTAPEWLQLLREVGRLREQQEVIRGGVSLNLPEQEVVADGTGWRVEYRSPLPVEGWNAQVSLLTGMAAADMMLAGGIGILRTLPPADPAAVDKLRRIAASLGIPWPREMGYPDFVRSLDVTKPRDLAMMTACTSLFRGAAYTLVDAGSAGRNMQHNALAANYAHCTAPLRRLVDRYVGEVCVHLCDHTAVPQWVADGLPELPKLMADSDHRAKKFERGVLDLVEALVLSTRVGEEFTATIVESDDKGRATISIADPATEASVQAAGHQLGDQVQVRLAAVDLVRGSVTFEVVA